MSSMVVQDRPDQAIAVVDAPPAQRKRVVIIGGGFAGLAAARALRHADAEVVLIDRRNHHIFQPLLYQVATAVLSPAEIAAPIRQINGSGPISPANVACALYLSRRSRQARKRATLASIDQMSSTKAGPKLVSWQWTSCRSIKLINCTFIARADRAISRTQLCNR